MVDLQGNAVDAQGVLIRLLQIGFATGSVVALGILLLQVWQVSVCDWLTACLLLLPYYGHS